MKSNAHIFFVALWINCALITHLPGQDVYVPTSHRFQHFDTQDGLPSEFAYGVVQDSLGFLWVLHDNGLTRYDGYNFKLYLNDPSDSTKISRTVTAGTSVSYVGGMLVRDQPGNIWMLSQEGTERYQHILNRYVRKKDAFTKYYPDLQGGNVVSMCFDKNRSTVWFGTSYPGKGLFRFDTEAKETKQYLNMASETVVDLRRSSPMEERNAILDVHDQDSVLLLATWTGLWQFDKTENKFKRPRCAAKDSVLLYYSPVLIVRSDTETKDLWFVMIVPGARELIKVGKNFDVIQRLRIPKGLDIKGITQDKEGIFWVSSRSGLYMYNPHDSTVVNIRSHLEDPYSLRSNFLQGLTIDRDQNIWVTTNDRGISKLKKPNPDFYNYRFNGEITGHLVYREQGQDFLVISTSPTSVYGDNEILLARILPKQLGALDFQRVELRNKILGRINSLAKGQNKLWILTWDSGVSSFTIDAKNGMINPGPMQTLKHDPGNAFTIPLEGNEGLWEDAGGNLWVGSFSGLCKIVSGVPYGADGSVIRYRHIPGDSNSISNNRIGREFYEEDERSFWVITEAGVDLMREGLFYHPFKNESSMTIRRGPSGNLLVGTKIALFESTPPGTDRFRKLSSPLINRYGAYSTGHDQLGRLWITNPHGLICYDGKERHEILFNEKDGLDFTRDWIGQTSQGILITADPKGVTLLDPMSLNIKESNTVPVLTGLTVNNEIPLINSNIERDQFSINSDITVLDKLVLDYKHNNFTVEFSSMELTSPEKSVYRHKLERYDNDWIETDWKKRTATYTNLNAGNYVFKVKASNYHGIWNNNETTLTVVILPPPWKTWWAYTIYGFLFLGMILYWRSYELKRVRLKQRAAYLGELDQVKTRFFANISHEFRTPISLILGPLKDLYNHSTTKGQKDIFGVMLRNGERLLRLINQLLDLTKIEAGKMQLSTTKVDLVEFLREIASSYESLAAAKGIKCTFNPEVPELVAFLDKEKMEKVIHNILSNAFKFTQEGEVTIRLKVQEKQSVVITVTDTGAGIPPDQLDKVFDRFYQADSSHTRRYEGSGLGMALAKELVELHHGRISVESTQGQGTVFTVWLPLGKEHLRKEEIIDSGIARANMISEDLFTENIFVSENENGKPAISSEEHPVLLIIEDNADMRNYIRKTLFEHYHILEARNGKEGLKKALETIPDLIISDVMMPEMDGYRLCELIKTKELTSHIPVILLTAKADQESKLTGLETGADDYLSKPFDADELKLIVRNRIEDRRRMRERFSREITLEPKQIAITSLDEKFLIKVMAFIEEHMADENFSIEELSREAGYSHMQFIRKIKALAGQTPSQFLRTIRLKRAAALLSAKSDNVSQIAFMVGFNSLPYFNKCFKEQFGVTPGSLRNQ